MLHPPLKPFQAQAIEILRSHPRMHLFCIAATGSGKSRIFEELARIPDPTGRPPCTILISPLQALVRQQIHRFLELGIDVVDHPEENATRAQALVCTPERLAARLDRGMSIPRRALLVVDECHCIEEWGREFRPEFSRVPRLVRHFDIHRSLWLSATLTEHSKQLLIRHLEGPVRQVGSFSVNEDLHVTKVRVRWPSRPAFVRQFIQRDSSPGILFCSTRSQCLELCRLLEHWTGRPEAVAPYHAGMSTEERLAVERGIRENRIRWVCATSAFGMGMNFTNLRWSILWQVPYGVLDLAQMIGRAGRVAGERARAFALWDDSDFFWLRHQIDEKAVTELRSIYEASSDLGESLRIYFAASGDHGRQ